jgi:Tol biopolymer transport system component
MTLPAGSRLGPYEIVAPLGVGGMGEVYKARDTRLERTVAVKVLASHLAASPEVRQRFEREAKTISQLSHPHICALHDVGREGEIEYLVMEYLEGETLSDRLAKGALPIDQVLRFGVQIADALDKAHRQGIVHRDLKPGNVMLTKSGVKLLDFGLAKAIAPAAPPESLTAYPTQQALTQEGTILGTFEYMAPEQIEGPGADPRTDIFAFGAVLYEMATGRKAFSGKSRMSLVSSVLRDHPNPISQVAPASPPSLDRLVQTCLAKDPDDRWQSAADVKRELLWIGESSRAEGAVSLPATERPQANRERLAWALAALFGAGLIALTAFAVLPARRTRIGPAPLVVRLPIPIPHSTTFAPGDVSRGASISPDGTRIAIEAIREGKRRLFVRPLDSEEAVELEGSTDASAHFWSPDGRFIAFFAGGKLKKIPATGGPPEELCDADFEIVGSWGRDGTILFTNFAPPGILRIPEKGGKREIVSPGRREDRLLPGWPHMLPDGRRFLYVVLGGQRGDRTREDQVGSRELRVGSLDSNQSRFVTKLDSRVEYAAGHLVFVRDGVLFAQRFDEKKAEVQGEPRVLSESVNYFFGPGTAAFSVSDDVLVFETARVPSRLVWLDPQGRELGTLGQPSVVKGFRVSPDGKRVAVDVGDQRTGTSDIWVFELERGVSTRLHSDVLDEARPLWSPDGTRIYFRSDQKGPPDIHEMTVGSPGSERPVLELDGVQQPEDVAKDGRTMAFLQDAPFGADVWIVTLQGDRRARPWLKTRFDERNPRFSPDGNWLAYDSDESGSREVYVARTVGAGDKRRVSTAGGSNARWGSDGKALYYVAPDDFIMSVPTVPLPRLEIGAPARLFHVETGIDEYDVLPDGTRFLVRTSLERVRESPIRLLLNWTAEEKSK